ncbi:MAG: peptidase MA family metallohydrolase [Byssovorax cruenta]
MRILITAFLLSVSLLTVFPAQAASRTDVSENTIVLNFPETVTFRFTMSSSAEINSIVLEYGSQQQTCGEVIAKAFPQFTPGKSVQAEWTWEMRQSGSLPPGAQLWWRWRVTDANGNETLTETKTATWLDDVHPWQTVSSDPLYLHYYGIDKAFAQEMLKAGSEGMKRSEQDAGLTTDAPIHIYVYPNYDDLREAILYESSWAGGSAFPAENIVILGTSGFDKEWDKDTVVHELAHVLVGHFTFTCLGYVPHWLDEGLATYSEGPLAPQLKAPLDEAIQDDTLLSIRILSGNFGESQNSADLSYAESYSIVQYLIDGYGQDKMTALLTAFRDGTTTDDALLQTYGFNIDGLEDAWRQAIGASPRTESAQPTVQPTPTFVPTIVPIAGGFFVQQATVTPVPTSSTAQSTHEAPSPSRTGPPLALTLILIGLCCALLLVMGIFVLGFMVRMRNSKDMNNDRQ